VIVIGGGDTGTDCVGTALRQGCRSLVQFEILAKPPMERAEDNPWPEWPKVYKLDYGQEEAAAAFGSDPRVYLTTVKRLNGDAAGKVESIVTVDIRWERRADGAMVPQEVPGTERTRPAQLVLLAMGFLGPEQSLLRDLKVDSDTRGNVRADYGGYATSVKGVFAAGDCRRGQSLVVWAINEGRGAARECDRYLMGSTQLP
jgi:glutamate synthase (NADPH) small chain